MRRSLSVILLLLLYLTACGKEKEEVLIAPSGEEHPVETIEGAEEGEAAGTETYSLYAVLPASEGPSAAERSVLRGAAEECGASFTALSYAGDPIGMANAFERAIRENASLIVCDNIDDTQTLRACRRAKEAGIPVILLGRGLDTMGIASYQVLTESYSCVRILAEKYLSYKKNRAACAVLLGEGTGGDLPEAFISVMQGKSGVTLSGEIFCDEQDKDAAYEAAWDLLNECRGADTVVCYNTVQTKAAIEAMGDLGRSMNVLCLNGDSGEVRSLIEEGKVWGAIVEPAETIAEKAAEQIKNYFLTGELPGSECFYVQGEILTGEEN